MKEKTNSYSFYLLEKTSKMYLLCPFASFYINDLHYFIILSALGFLFL
jgi:hypothetical protein